MSARSLLRSCLVLVSVVFAIGTCSERLHAQDIDRLFREFNSQYESGSYLEAEAHGAKHVGYFLNARLGGRQFELSGTGAECFAPL